MDDADDLPRPEGTPDPGAPVAVIDLGTHSCLLLVGRAVDGRLELLDDRCEIPALGEGLAASGRLGAGPRARALEVLGEFAARARAAGCARILATGTAAMRSASNADLLVAAARERHGLELVVLPADREALLAWRAAAGPGGDPGTRVVDVGGGSTEVAAAGGAARRSVPLGAVLLTEQAGPDATWEDLLGAARGALGAGPPLDAPPGPTVAIGGTATNLGSLGLGLAAFDHLAVEGARVPLAEARAWGERLAGMTPAERRELPIEAARAVVLPAGLACLTAALERLGLGDDEPVEVTGRGLRHGLLAELLGLAPPGP